MAKPASRTDLDAELAERMIRVLESLSRNSEDYPPTLGQLCARCCNPPEGYRESPELVNIKPSDPRFLKAAVRPDFKRQAIVAWNKDRKPDREAPIFLVGEALDAEVAEATPTLLLAILERERNNKKSKTRAFTVAKIKDKLVERLRKPFKEAIGHGMEHRSLPAEIGWLKAERSVLLFLVASVESSAASIPTRPNGQADTPAKSHGHPAHAETGPYSHSSPPPSFVVKPGAPAPDFATAFRAAFDRLDRQSRLTNFVRLLDLRQALPEFDRAQFDAGLRQLRIDGEFTLDTHEGRHGPLTEPEREAGVREAGSLLVYVSRRS